MKKYRVINRDSGHGETWTLEQLMEAVNKELQPGERLHSILAQPGYYQEAILESDSE